MVKFWRILVLSFIIGSALPSCVWAAQDITVSPSSQQIILKSDEREAHVAIEVQNSTSSSYTMQLMARDFGTLDQSGGVAFLGDKDPGQYRLANWISVAQQMDLPSGSKVDVPIVINNDASLAPGGHYAAIILTFASSGRADSNIAVHQSMAALLMVTKQGGATFGIKLDSWELQHGWLGQPQTARLTFSATGNSQIVPRGTIETRDSFGRLVSKGVINAQSREVLPDKPQTLTSTMQYSVVPLWPGLYSTRVSYRDEGSSKLKTAQSKYFAVGLLVPIGLPLVAWGVFLIWRFRPRIRRVLGHRK